MNAIVLAHAAGRLRAAGAGAHAALRDRVVLAFALALIALGGRQW